MVLIQAPPGASLDYTMGIVRQAEQVMKAMPETNKMFAAGGFGFSGTAPNQGILFAQLKDFDQRRGEEHSAKALVGKLFGAFSSITGAMVIPFLPPSINGLGNFGGITYELLDQSGGPIENLEAAAQQLIAQGNQTPGLTGAVHPVHRQRSAGRRRHRSRAGEEPRDLDRRRDQHDADPARLGLRQRLRLQRPLVSRLRAGRSAVPIEPGRHREVLACARPAAAWRRSATSCR